MDVSSATLRNTSGSCVVFSETDDRRDRNMCAQVRRHFCWRSKLNQSHKNEMLLTTQSIPYTMMALLTTLCRPFCMVGVCICVCVSARTHSIIQVHGQGIFLFRSATTSDREFWMLRLAQLASSSCSLPRPKQMIAVMVLFC